MLIDWTSGPGFAEKENVGGDDGEDAGRNQENVRDEKARNGEGAHFVAAAHQALDGFADERDFARGICANGRGKVRALIPGQKIAGKSHPKY